MPRNNLLIVTLLFSLMCVFGNAAPLWLNGNDLYSSNGAARSYKPGDIITISISESSNATSKAKTSTTKETSMDVSASPNIPVFKKVMKNVIGKQKTNNEFEGEGTTTRSGSLTGTVTAIVLEVLDNGNLLIEGSRSIVVNKENQIMRVRGIARPKDINSNNTIDSKMLADAKIKYEGKGSVNSATRRGLMTRFFDAVF